MKHKSQTFNLQEKTQEISTFYNKKKKFQNLRKLLKKTSNNMNKNFQPQRTKTRIFNLQKQKQEFSTFKTKNNNSQPLRTKMKTFNLPIF